VDKRWTNFCTGTKLCMWESLFNFICIKFIWKYYK